MDSEDLRTYVKRSQSIIDSSPQMDEENTKVKLINPLIQLLGWDIYSRQVELEYTVKIATTSTKVDYALTLDDHPVVFIEAKGLDTDITQNHREQLGSYMRQKGVNWGLLTNGKIYEVLKRETDNKAPSEKKLGSFNLEMVKEDPIALNLLSKNSLESGDSKTIAESLESKQRAISVLRDEKSEIANKVSQTIAKTIDEPISQEIESESKSFIDELIETLEGSLKHIHDDGQEVDVDQTDRYVVTLSKNGSIIETFEADAQPRLMAQVADFLVENHNLADQISIPFVPGRTRAVLNKEAKHPDGEEMRNSYQIRDGYHVETHANPRMKQRWTEALVEKCGLEVEFSGSW